MAKARSGRPGKAKQPRVAKARRARAAKAQRLKGAPVAVLILAAYPSLEAAEAAAVALVRERVLACATVTTGKAFYAWEGREVAEPSAVLHGKTTAARVGEAKKRIRASHPDKVPEILVIDIVDGHPDYLAWIAEQVEPR